MLSGAIVSETPSVFELCVLGKIMKIVVISTLATGGAACAAVNTHRALQAAGHNSSLYFLEAGEEGGLSLSWPGAAEEEQRFWTGSIFQYWSGLAVPKSIDEGKSELFSSSLLALHGLSPHAADAIGDADVINLHWMAGILPSPELLALLPGKKIVLTLHDMNAFTGGCHYHISCRRFEEGCGQCPLLEHSFADDLSRQGFLLKKQIYTFLTPTVITPSAWLAGQVQASALLGGRPTSVVGNAHDLEVFHPLPEEERLRLRRQMGIKEDALVVMVASVELNNQRKNLSMFFDAWRQVLAAMGDRPTALLLAGHGDFPEDIQGHKAGYVAASDKMAELYALADLFVHPSLIDNLPNTTCEAQCCGTPVLAFNAGGNVETFLPGDSGFAVKEITLKGLAEGLVAALDAPVRLREMRGRAREFAEKNFSPEILAEKYVRIFSEVAMSASAETPPELGAELQQNQINSLAALLRVAALQAQQRISCLEQGLLDIERRIVANEQADADKEKRMLVLDSVVTRLSKF